MANEKPPTRQEFGIRRVCRPIASMREGASQDAERVNELIYGALVHVLRIDRGWAYVRAVYDGYEGYILRHDLSGNTYTPTHCVARPSTIALRLPRTSANEQAILYMGSLVRVTHIENGYGCTDSGWVRMDALLSVGTVIKEELRMFARRFLDAPYKWAGRTVRGPDCSGWLQIALQMLGIHSPRDTSQMQECLGALVASGPDISIEMLKENDLIFWPDHVAVYVGNGMIIHATAYHGCVLMEPLQDAIDMRLKDGKAIACVRRLSFE